MIQVTKFWCRSFDLDRIDLFWEIAPVPGPRLDEETHEIFNYEVYVLRSGDSPMGPYETISGPLIDKYVFRDSTVKLLHKWRQYHYWLKVVDRRTGEMKSFGPCSSSEAPPDLIASEIMRQEDILFREFVGRRCWLFPIRTFGPRCSCFEPTLGRPTRSGHLPCFGTGFLGGYMAPIEVFIQIDPNGKNSQRSQLQEVQQSDTVGRMISFPPVHPRDILVETENVRWRVMAVQTTQRLRSVVRQEIQLHEVPRGDIEYTLPVRVDEKSILPASERNFTNKQNLERDDQYADILTAYNYDQGFPRP